MKEQTLSKELEQSLLKGILDGICSPSLLKPSELSKQGGRVLSTARHLLKMGSGTPLSTDAISLTASRVYGLDETELLPYLQELSRVALGQEPKAIIQIAQQKSALTAVLNMAGSQLHSGDPDLVKLSELLSTKQSESFGDTDGTVEEELQPFSDYVNGEWKDAPQGWDIPSLPTLSQATRGVMGIWIVAGEPGLGKSTLAWQVALEVGREAPVLFYDLDGTGAQWMAERTRGICGENQEKFKELTKQVYLKGSIGSFERDLVTVRPPALVVVDSVQTLPTRVNYRRTGIDQWLVDFKKLNQEGYTFLLISEIPRWMYGKVGMAVFKETGELEYAGSLCAQLAGDPSDRYAPVEFHILKSRHTEDSGHILNMNRDPDKVWWFREEQ